MVKTSQIADGLALFAEKEILPALGGWQMWTASAALVLFHQKSEIILQQFLSNKAVAMLGLADENGMIDIDAAVETAKETVQRKGKLELELPLLGKCKFSGEDFDKLREYIVNSEA